MGPQKGPVIENLTAVCLILLFLARFKEAERAMEVARERLSEANKPLQQKEEEPLGLLRHELPAKHGDVFVKG